MSRAVREANLERECRRAVGTMEARATAGSDPLSAGVAHDLNNLLASVAMAVSMLRGTLPDPERERMISIIEDSAPARERDGARVARRRTERGG